MKRTFLLSLVPTLDSLFVQQNSIDGVEEPRSRFGIFVEAPVETAGEAASDPAATGRSESSKLRQDQGPPQTLQIALAGPAGTGKSVLALHYATGFALFNAESLVIYVSTDLSLEVAKRQQASFGLENPGPLIQDPLSTLISDVPLSYPWYEGFEENIRDKDIRVSFKSVNWEEDSVWTDLIYPHSTDKTGAGRAKKNNTEESLAKERHIYFLDFQSSATGDDWTYLERFFSSKLPLLKRKFSDILVVIDAVEGLDAAPGEFRGADIRHQRRQRLAKLLEATSGLAHVVYTLESGNGTDDIADEEFVADIVVRLRREGSGDSRKLTLEVTKARGMLTRQGIHHLTFNGGRGTTSFEQQNIDDLPRLASGRTRSAVEIHPCLSWLEEQIERSSGRQIGDAETKENHKFDLDGLDKMLDDGLRPGKVFAIVGEVDTHKSRLARKFLKASFVPMFKDLGGDKEKAKNRSRKKKVALDLDKFPPVCLFRGGRSLPLADLKSEIFIEANVNNGRGIHEAEATWKTLTNTNATSGINVEQLSTEQRVFFRRLPNRSMSPESLYYIIKENLRAAVLTLARYDGVLLEEVQKLAYSFPERSYVNAWKIRVVIDDFSAVLATYGLSEQKDLIVPAIVDLLRLAGVTAIIVDSHVGGPLDLSASGSHSMLRSKVDHTIFTWKVPYGSGSKVAIAAFPPMRGDKPVLVRELAVDAYGSLKIDRCLELYLDVLPSQANQGGGLRRVPLKVLVATDGDVWADDTLRRITLEHLTQTLGTANDAFGGSADDPPLVRVVSVPRSKLETFINYNDMAAESETVVAMVDEYWDKVPLHRGTVADDRFLDVEDKVLSDNISERIDKCLAYDASSRLIPFTWNFGLMLIRRNPWVQVNAEIRSRRESQKEDSASVGVPGIRAEDEDSAFIIERIAKKIERMQRELENPYAEPDDDRDSHGRNAMVFWHEFLRACQLVSSRHAVRYDRNQLKSYELDLTDGQSLTCLVLETWFSTCVWLDQLIGGNVIAVKDRNEPAHATALTASAERVAMHFDHSYEGCCSMVETVKNGLDYIANQSDTGSAAAGQIAGLLKAGIDLAPDVRSATYTVALYLTVLMLAEAVNFEDWELDESSHVFKSRPSMGNAVAGRYWYTSACQMLRAKGNDGSEAYDPDDPFLPMALPGMFSTRGDWNLATLKSSRSAYLGELAISELIREKACSIRMQQGLGLPPFVLGKHLNQPEINRRVRTALPSPSGGRLATFSYQSLREMAPCESNVQEHGSFGHTLCLPIRRSRIPNYLDQHSLFLKGVCRLITSFEDAKRKSGTSWHGFEDVFAYVEQKAVLSAVSDESLDSKAGAQSGTQHWKQFLELLLDLSPEWRSEILDAADLMTQDQMSTNPTKIVREALEKRPVGWYAHNREEIRQLVHGLRTFPEVRLMAICKGLNSFQGEGPLATWKEFKSYFWALGPLSPHTPTSDSATE